MTESFKQRDLKYLRHKFKWAQENPDKPGSKQVLDLHAMYHACPEPACYGLLESALQDLKTE